MSKPQENGERIRLLLTDAGSGTFSRRVQGCKSSSKFSLLLPENDAEETLIPLAERADAILCFKANVTRRLIRASQSLRFIQKFGVDCKNIDISAASERDVRVATLPLMRNVTVAEHAMALLLACARKIIPGHLSVVNAAYERLGLTPRVTSQWNHGGNWSGIEGLTELFHKRVGIVGMGDIGIEIAARCRAFRMDILYYQRVRHPAKTETTLGINYAPLHELLSASDYVILVIPQTPATLRLIGAKELALLKPSAILINVARGAVIDEGALTACLKDGRIAMAGLDVFETEPLPSSSPLITLPNVVLLPHTGAGSNRFWGVDIPAALENILRFFRTEKVSGVVNPTSPAEEGMPVCYVCE